MFETFSPFGLSSVNKVGYSIQKGTVNLNYLEIASDWIHVLLKVVQSYFEYSDGGKISIPLVSSLTT